MASEGPGERTLQSELGTKKASVLEHSWGWGVLLDWEILAGTRLGRVSLIAN